MTRLPFAFVLLTAAILAACSAAGAPGPSAASLDGRIFLSTAIDGATLVPNTQVRLSFTDGNLNANAGCNHLGGAYTTDGNRIVTGQMSTTEMGCEEPLMTRTSGSASS